MKEKNNRTLCTVIGYYHFLLNLLRSQPKIFLKKAEFERCTNKVRNEIMKYKKSLKQAA